VQELVVLAEINKDFTQAKNWKVTENHPYIFKSVREKILSRYPSFCGG
jgi:hypothetical protein